MRVLFLASWFPTRVHPTHGNFVEKHARTVARSQEVFVLTIQADPSLITGKFELRQLQKDNYSGLCVYFGQVDNTPAWRRVWLRACAWLKGLNYYRRTFGHPHIVHAHVLLDAGIVAAFHQLFTGTPLLITEHSTAYWSAGALPGIRGLLGRWAAGRAAYILPVSTALGRAMRENHRLYGQYRTIGNVVNTRLFHYQLPPEPTPFVFLHVSNFRDWHKNVSGLLRAFKYATKKSTVPLKLRLAGDGNLTDWQSSIADLNLAAGTIEISGPHPESEVAALMQAAHAFVLFSNVENQPVVVLEALSCGRPCITTPVGGLPELITVKNGISVPVGDEAAMTDALLKMAANYSIYNGQEISDCAGRICGEAAIQAAFNQVYAEAIKGKLHA